MKSSTMKKFATAYVVGGIILSIVSAILVHKAYSSGILTFVSLVVSIIVVIVAAFPLFALAEVMETGEYNLILLTEMMEQNGNTIPARPSENENSSEEYEDFDEASGDEWKCPECGNMNPSTTQTCLNCYKSNSHTNLFKL